MPPATTLAVTLAASAGFAVACVLYRKRRARCSRILSPPLHGIGGMFEICIGCSDLDELETQVKYWKLFGYAEHPEETPRGQLSATQSEQLYGVRSNLISVRLFHSASRSDHGLVRLLCFTDVELRPSFVPELDSLRYKGARWGAMLTDNVFNILHHAEDVKAEGATIKWMGPHRSTIYKSIQPEAGGKTGDLALTAWSATSACVRECVFFQPMAVQNCFQRYEYSIAKYGHVDPSSKFKTSQITHFGLISQGAYEEISFYEEVLGLLKTTPDEGKLFSYDDAEPGDCDILGLKQKGDRFRTTNVDSPESSLDVRQYVSGRLHILRYAEDMPTPVEDKRDVSRPGTRGPCNYTLRVADATAMRAKIAKAKGVSCITETVQNEFGESSFSFVAPDGYFWSVVEIAA